MSFFHLFMTIRQQSQAWKELVPRRIHIHAPFGNHPGDWDRIIAPAIAARA
jgi:hypothetical protein